MQKIFRTTRFQLKFLILIEFPNILNWKPAKRNQIRCGLGAKFEPNYVQYCHKSKETCNMIRFFSYFTWAIPFKAKSSVAKPPECKFMTIIARNVKFYGQKTKSTVYFTKITT